MSEVGTSRSDLMAPIFTVPLADQFARVGTNIRLKCNVKAEPMPAVVWFKNDQPAEAPCAFEDGIAILDIIHVTVDDQATYTCRATNVRGTADTHCRLDITSTSVSAYLKIFILPIFADFLLLRYLCLFASAAAVDLSEMSTTQSELSAPKFTVPLKEVEMVRVGEKIRFKCNVKGVPTPSVEWTKDGETVKTGDHIYEDGIAILDLGRAEHESHAVYTCTAVNAAGHAVTTCNLDIICELMSDVPYDV